MYKSSGIWGASGPRCESLQEPWKAVHAAAAAAAVVFYIIV